MSNKDNLPVKYEEAGKPKVKEQVTEWVEQVEVFDGFNFDIKLLIGGIIFFIVGGGISAFLGASLPDDLIHPIFGVFGALTCLGAALAAYDSWQRRIEGGPLMFTLYVVQTILYGSALTICLTGSLIAVLGSDTGILIFVIGSLMYLPALVTTYVEDCVQTRTEERVVSSNEGDQL